MNFFAHRHLTHNENSSDQFAFPAHRHVRKPFEPFPNRHFRMGFKPVGKQHEVLYGKLAGFHAIHQVSEQCWGQVLATYFWHILCPLWSGTGFWLTGNINCRKSRG